MDHAPPDPATSPTVHAQGRPVTPAGPDEVGGFGPFFPCPFVTIESVEIPDRNTLAVA
jgi:hypothetical protein